MMVAIARAKAGATARMAELAALCSDGDGSTAEEDECERAHEHLGQR